MRVLIGTPIHISKDYAMEQWLENVAKLQKNYPADVLLVDNSSTLEYVANVKDYCVKRGIRNYQIDHIKIDEKLGTHIRIEASQETIRQYVLAHHYDAWFSWECDQIIPADALNKLITLMSTGGFMMVVHNSWARWDSTTVNTNMGVTLIRRACLQKSWFLPQKNGGVSLDPTDSYDIHEAMFKKRVLKSGGNYAQVYGIIKPIYHLDR